MKKNKTRNILFINPFGIGDVIFTTPVLRSVKTKYPNSKVAYLCNKRAGMLFSSDPNVDKVFILERDEYRKLWRRSKLRCIKKIFRLYRNVKKENFDMVLDFSMSKDYGFFPFLAGIKRRIGYNYKNRGIFLTDKICLEDAFSGKHVIDHHKEFLPIIGEGFPTDTLPKIYLSEEEESKAAKTLFSYGVDPEDDYVCIMPGCGASWGKNAYRKRWPIDRFAEVALRVSSEAKIILLGSSDEKELCREIQKSVPCAVDLSGELSLMASMAVIKHAQALLTNDGGPIHMAVAVGAKTVSIFGPVDEKVYGPYAPPINHRVIRDGRLSCSPCYKSFRLPECKDLKCLKNIRADEVFEALISLIS